MARRRSGDGPVMNFIYLVGIFGPMILLAFLFGRHLL
ncbi:hypothetical protein SAMN05428942_7307 [Streptomyces sp. 2112.2]|nr:hypothetical protein SAMN05428942_7307 [Streptomyces sp. 2112.2]